MTHWLLRAYPYDGNAVKTVYASLWGWVTEPDETNAAPNTYWDRRIEVPMSTSVSLFEGDAVGGRSTASYGNVKVANADGGLDHWLDWAWDGRTIELYRSDLDRPRRLSDFTLVTRRTVEEIVPGDSIELVLTDAQARFTAPARRGVFTGAGGLEGPSSLKGRAKPFLLGVARRFEPVLINAEKNVYMIDPAGFSALLSADDGGAPFVIGPDTTDYTGLVALDMGSLDLATSKAAGLIRLSEKPLRRLRISAQGVAPGGTWIYRAGDLVRHIATAFVGLTDAEIDDASINALNALQPAVLGYWADGGSAETAEGLIDRIMDTIGGFWGISEAGLLTVGRYDLAALTAVARFTRRDIIDLIPQQAARRVKSVRLSYRPGMTLSETEIADGVATAERELAVLDREWTAPAVSADTSTQSLLSQELEKDTLFDDPTAAAAERDRLLTLLSQRRQPFDITLPLVDGAPIGSTIEIQDTRYGLSNGRKVVVLRRSVDTEPDLPTLTLTVL